MKVAQYKYEVNDKDHIDSSENIKESIIIAARDGNNTSILRDFIQGKFSQELCTQEVELINSAIYTATLNSQQESLVTLLNEGKTDISGLANNFFFDEIQSLQQNLLGSSLVED